MIRLAGGSSNLNKFPGASTPPFNFLGRFYLGAFTGGSNYTGTFNHGLNKTIRYYAAWRRSNGPGSNESEEYLNVEAHQNQNAFGTCTMQVADPNTINYGVYLVGNGGVLHYWFDFYGDDAVGPFISSTVLP